MEPDEAKLRHDVIRAGQAKYLLEDSLLKEALTAVEDAATDLWQSKDGSPEDRERAWLMYQLTQKFKEHLGTIINGGTLANHQLVAIEKRKKFTLMKGRK